MALSIERRTAGDVVILNLKGRVTIGRDTEDLNDAFRGELGAKTRKLVVNLSGVVQVDSSGLATLVRAYISMTRTGGAMRLVITPGRIREVFDVLQLSSVIDTFADEAAALASFD